MEALGVNAPDTMSSSNGTIIAANGQNIELYSNFTIASPYKITIWSVNEDVKFNNTILTLDIKLKIFDVSIYVCSGYLEVEGQYNV